MSKTNKVMAGITSTALLLGLAGCNSNTQSISAPPDDSSCRDWEWDDDDGVWECDDSSSSHYGHYYYGGHYYNSKSSLFRSKDYSTYKNSSSFKGSTSGGSATGTVKKSSGFGSGSKSFGG